MAEQHISFARVLNCVNRIVPCLAIPPQILFGFNSFQFRVHGNFSSPRAEQKTCNFGLPNVVPRDAFIERPGPACYLRSMTVAPTKSRAGWVPDQTKVTIGESVPVISLL